MVFMNFSGVPALNVLPASTMAQDDFVLNSLLQKHMSLFPTKKTQIHSNYFCRSVFGQR